MLPHLRRWFLLGAACCGLVVCPAASAQAVRPAADTLSAAPLTADAVADEAVEARLRRVFARIDEFEQVGVAVSDGVVHLTGTVLQPEASEAAEALAGRFEGVLYVDNDLQAETDVESRLAPAIERVQGYLDRAAAFLPVLGVALLVVLLFGLLSWLLGRWEAPLRRFGVNPLVWGFVRRLLRALVFLTGLLLAFDILGITTMVGAVLGTAGVLGLALGFAFQDIVENYLAGVLLSLRRPFGVNDLVRIGEHEGRVMRLTSRELLLLSLEGNHIRLPNATVFKNTLLNYSLNPRRLFSFDAGIGVDEQIDRAMEVGVTTLDAMNGVMADPPPFARVQELGASSVVVRFHGWVDQQAADYYKVRSEAIRLVKVALDEAGIEMPEPIYRVGVRRLPEGPPAGAARPEASALHQAQRVDVTPDRNLEEQVDEDLARSDEENLLVKE